MREGCGMGGVSARNGRWGGIREVARPAEKDPTPSAASRIGSWMTGEWTGERRSQGIQGTYLPWLADLMQPWRALLFLGQRQGRWLGFTTEGHR